MRISTLAPIGFAALMAIAGVAAAVSPAAAATHQHMSDAAYLAAARCAGIAQGLGSDAAELNKLLDDQDGGREPFVNERAATAKDDAARTARHAGPEMKAHLTAEWEGSCKAIAG